MASSIEVGSYAPKELTMIINHPVLGINHVLTGFAEDTFISIDRGDPTWAKTRGAKGDIQRTHKAGKDITATISLMQTSATNDILSGIAAYDATDLRGGGLFTCSIVDGSGRSYLHSHNSWVSIPTNQDYSTTATTRDWIFELPDADQFLGGNNRVSQAHAAIMEKLGYTVDESWIAG